MTAGWTRSTGPARRASSSSGSTSTRPLRPAGTPSNEVRNMPKFSWDAAEELKRVWTDRLVTAKTDRPELQRFAGRVGRVVTVNWSGKAIVDFSDGAWYDIPASEDYLTPLAADDPLRAKYDGT